jgi:N-acetylglucosaminyldiphosphoundecaprenol N-acetyl-beta-D-mannosaminyltransferase
VTPYSDKISLPNPTFDGYEFQSDPFALVMNLVKSKQKVNAHVFHLVAVSTLQAAARDLKLSDVLSNGVLICDSTPIAAVINRTGKTLVVSRGTDFLRFVLTNEPGFGRHYFLGGTQEALNRLMDQVNKDFPAVQVVGSFSPPFTENSDFIEDFEKIIVESKPDFVWVGMGSPKQDFIAEEITRRFGVTTFAVGAAFDFLSGNVPECPKLLRGTGLEWLYRLLLEPRRLWKRYMLGSAYFLRIALKEFSRYFSQVKTDT